MKSDVFRISGVRIYRTPKFILKTFKSVTVKSLYRARIKIYSGKVIKIHIYEDNTMEILKCEHLTKEYGSGSTLVKALDDVSFSVEKGEFLAIIGPSGSGKSTLLHTLGGVDRPTSGKVYMDGQDVYAQDEENLAIFRRRYVGLIYQFYNLIPVLNVVENITLPVLMDGRKVNQERLEELLDILKLNERKENLPNQLSGGQQQRVSIGRAVVKNPDILMCDEPTGALDYKTSKEILALIEDCNKKFGNTVIMVTHNEAIKNMADHVIKLRDGVVRHNDINENKISAFELEW